MNLDGANVESVTTPAVKLQEWTAQMLTKIDRDRSSTFRSATMRASYMSINRVDVQQAVKEVACFMEEPNESWRARAGELGTEVRQGTTRRHCQRLRRMRAYQEKHDVCSCLPWREPDQDRELDARHAKSDSYAGVKGASILLGANIVHDD